MSELPRRIWAKGGDYPDYDETDRDSGQWQDNPHWGAGLVEYIRADLAAERAAELLHLLDAARNHIDMFGYALSKKVAEDDAHEVRRKMNDILLRLDHVLLAKHEAERT